jgi:hypothetical protein
MLTKFWETVGSKLAEHWVARVLTPAFAFWAGGLLAVAWDGLRADVRTQGWAMALRGPAAALQALPVVIQGALVLGLLGGLVVSALVAERLTLPLLRLLEGYWPRGRPRWLRDKLIRRHAGRRAKDQPRFSELFGKRQRGGLTPGEYTELRRLELRLKQPATPAGSWLPSWARDWLLPADGAALEPARQRHQDLVRKRDSTQLSPAEVAELGRLEWRLRRVPVSPALTMPTRLGNLLRAAEERPRLKYGLDTVAIWPQFWLVLPKDTRDELLQARAALDAAARLWLWSVLFVVWTPWALWALPIALVVAAATYYGSMLDAAEVYGDLVEAAFDVHRGELYKAARWPPTATPGEEARAGAALTEYLWRGTAPPGAAFDQQRP